MRSIALSALILAACQPGSDDGFPVVPGGGGGGGGTTPSPDGPTDASDGASGSINGRICLVTDLRNLTTCSTGDASGITVALGTSTAMTALDGSFTISVPQGSNLVWSATAPDTVQSVMPLGVVHLIPVVTAARYAEMLLDNGVILQAGQGSVFVRAIKNAAAAPGVVATVDPPSQFGPLYDGTGAILWDADATASAGVVWIPDALQGTATMTLTAPASTAVMISVPVVDGAITFATLGIP